MKQTLQRIEEIKRTGYRLDLGEAINETFANYKNIALLGGAVILVFVLAAVVIVGGATAMIIGAASFTESITEYGSGIITSTALVVRLVSTILAAGLFAPVTAGIIQMAHNAATNEEFDFGTAFMHFKTVHFKELFLGTALITLVGSGLTTAAEFLQLGDTGSSLFILSTGITSIISGLIQIFTMLMIPLIIFGKLNAIDAIKGSFVLVSKNFWLILLLSIIFGIFVMLGIIAICIGILFTYPILHSMQYIIYKTALPIEENNELDEIGKNYF